MITRDFLILNRLGIHARPATLFTKTANQYKSTIRVEKDGLEVNGKSIMGIMMLAAAKGNTIRIQADGDDEDDAIQALKELIQNKFGEE